MNKVKLASLLGIAVLNSPIIHANVESRFDNNLEGWQVVSFNDFSQNNYGIIGDYTPDYVVGGGNPGNYISMTDPDGGDFTFAAPAAFLGNQANATGLSYDLRYSGGEVNWQTTDVMLVGNGKRLLWKSNPDIVPTGDWSHIGLTFTPSAAWTVDLTTGALAGASDFHNVLSNLSGLYIHGEYTNGIVETAGLDNVTLTAVPSPAAFWLFAPAVAGWLPVARKRAPIK